MNTNNTLKHWSQTTDETGIAWLTLNVDGDEQSANTLSAAVLDELTSLLETLNIKLPKALVIQSAKRGHFILGADIEEIGAVSSVDEATALLKRGHKTLDLLEALPVPTVALVHGFCLGGGFELALACDYCVTEKSSACRVGLPEVKLGIHPGFGGSVRLIERIGALNAMSWMLAGRTVPSAVAKKQGAVDACVPKRHFVDAAKDLIKRQPKTKPKWAHRVQNLAIVRPLIATVLRRQVSAKANPAHYPAPFALIDLWAEHGGNRTQMLTQEIESVANLANSSTARSLVDVFFLQEKLKRLGKEAGGEKIGHVHVIGAGVMGGDIAAWSAFSGLTVTLQDMKEESIGRAFARAHKLFCKKLRKPRDIQAAMDRLTADPKGLGLAYADLVIEAIFEDLEVKRSVFKQVEASAKKTAVFASNTSSIPIEQIAEALKQPGRLVGIHFFNPVAKMPLVELVLADKTTPAAKQLALTYINQIKRLPLPVKSAPGFLVNRVLMPYLLEAMTMHQEGTPAALLDKAAEDFGMPMGPIELADVVGLDICHHVAKNLSPDSDFSYLEAMIEDKHLGKKTKQGFYSYKKGKAIKPKIDAVDAHELTTLAERMLFPLFNECIDCLHDGIVEDEDSIDAGVIFGTGFAPFKAGPLHALKAMPYADAYITLQKLHEAHGDRFKPSDGWTSLLTSNDDAVVSKKRTN